MTALEIPYGIADPGPPEKQGGLPFHIIWPAPPSDRHDLLHFLRRVVAELEDAGVAYSLTLIAARRDAMSLSSMFAPELARDSIRIVTQGSIDELSRLLRRGDVLITMDGVPFAMELPEAMSLGLAIVAIVGPTKNRAADIVVDGNNGFVIPIAKPEKCSDVLVELATHLDKRAEICRTAYNDGHTRSSDIEYVCDQFAALLDEMLVELRNDRYTRPEPIFYHPAFGGLSLPPALQFDPDAVAKDSFGTNAEGSDFGRSDQAKVGNSQFGWAPEFELTRDGPQPAASGQANLRWRDDELEITSSDGDGGIIIDLTSNQSHILILRMTLRTNTPTDASILSQTIAEVGYSDTSKYRFALKSGLNEVKIEIVRNVSIRALCVNFGAHASIWCLQRLTVLAPAGAAQDLATRLPMTKLVEFSSGGNDTEYLAGTWYDSESNLRWARAGQGEVRFTPEFPDHGDVKLWVLCRVAGTAALGEVEITVKLGSGAEADKWVFHDDSWQLKPVTLTPPMHRRTSAVHIIFYREDVDSMESLGLSPDPRELGIAVSKMGVFESSMPINDIKTAFQFMSDK